MLYSAYIYKRKIQLLPELKIQASFQIKQYIQYFYFELTIKKYFLNSDQTILFFSGSVLDSILKVDREIDRISNIRLFFEILRLKLSLFFFSSLFFFFFCNFPFISYLWFINSKKFKRDTESLNFDQNWINISIILIQRKKDFPQRYLFRFSDC